MKKIIFLAITMIFAGWLSSCADMDVLPMHELTDAQIAADPEVGIELTTNGMYQWFHRARTGGGAPGGRFIRDWQQCNEFRGDNLLIAGVTEDPLMLSYNMRDTERDRPARNIWYIFYSIIDGTNTNIRIVEEGLSPKVDHILGENYFLRAFSYLGLCDIFSYPYTNTKGGANGLGVVIRLEDTVDDGNLKRATLSEVYAQIEKDAKKAYELMNKNNRRSTNAGYASKEAARALLSRLYLYQGRYQDCINMANEMLEGAAAASKLDANLQTYFTRTQTSSETLWCIGMTATESHANGSIASMMLKDPVTGGGWGEIYTSDPLYELFTRYPEDIRWSGSTSSRGPADGMHYFPPSSFTYNGSPAREMVHWPVEIPSVEYLGLTFRCIAEDSGGKYIIFENDPNLSPNAPTDGFFSSTSTKIYVQSEIENTYTRYFFMYNGTKYRVTLTPATHNLLSYRQIFNFKFSGQDNNNMLSSIVMLRWSEVILNRAEAYAKLDNVDAALEDVNTIRTRAGLSGDALMTRDNMGPRGYADILDVVLDERRLEFAYEGFRWKDLYRNNKPMDRRFGGTHPWEIVQPTDTRIPFAIPWEERTYNPGVEPNPR